MIIVHICPICNSKLPAPEGQRLHCPCGNTFRAATRGTNKNVLCTWEKIGHRLWECVKCKTKAESDGDPGDRQCTHIRAGDVVSMGLAAIGIVKKRKGCNCKKRQDILNKLTNF